LLETSTFHWEATSSSVSTAFSLTLLLTTARHWRYISNYHGPWLQLPPEVLESIANTNYYTLRPHTIDPAVLFDMLKIRKNVDEATELAVRAAAGVTSHQSNIANSNSSLHNGAAALGLTFGNNGPVTKLSRERKHRMREMASQKLSACYHADEIAASVAMMQSTSTLEELAGYVLQRSPDDYDSRYVQFFHEKIPSRMMAEYTPLTVLNQLISERPQDPSVYRTRALTRLFKDDLAGAAHDLTQALAIARTLVTQHNLNRSEIPPKYFLDTDGHYKSKDWRTDKVDEKDQPSSLITQLSFHRAGVYLRIACQSIRDALETWKSLNSLSAEESDARTKAHLQQRHMDLRKVVKSNARKALRDYMTYLEQLEYTPGHSLEKLQAFLKENTSVGGSSSSTPTSSTSEVVKFTKSSSRAKFPDFSTMPPAPIYKASELFNAAPLADLPPFPPRTSTELVLRSKVQQTTPAETVDQKLADSHAERVTYHPLLVEALHSLLLCHALVQTSPTELRRHAYNAARLTKYQSGFPVFLHARCTSRADWNEVLRMTENWIELEQPWSWLCRSPSAPQESSEQDIYKALSTLSAKEKEEAVTQKAIAAALADERVVDDETFRKAVLQRQEAFNEAESNGTQLNEEFSKAKPTAKDWASDPTNDFPGFSTERAEVIARWILEAPLTVDGAKSKKAGRRKPKRAGPTLEDGLDGQPTTHSQDNGA